MSNKQSYNQSFANLKYDKCALEKKESENKRHFEWTTDVNYGQSKNKCFVGLSPFSHNPNNSIAHNLVDIESDLFGQTRPLSKCPSVHYNPMVNCDKCCNCNVGIPCGCSHCKKNKMTTLKECNNFLDPEYTRVKKSCNIFSGININRFDLLCEDFQDINKIQDNCYIGSNTRLNVRDLYTNQNNQNSQKRNVDMSKIKTITQCNKVPYDENCVRYQ